LISLPISILSYDERRKAEVAEYGEHLVVNYYTVTHSCSGEIGWRFDREAIVKIKPVEAALDTITNILNAPPRR
jgi:hypothetical protein